MSGGTTAIHHSHVLIGTLARQVPNIRKTRHMGDKFRPP